MGEVITLVSGRGGTGKSTLTGLIGEALSAQGRKVLLIDMNAGMRCLDQLLGVDHLVVYDLMDVSDGRCKSKKAILSSEGRPDLLPASQTRKLSELDVDRFVRMLEQMREKYDCIILDCASGWNLSSQICSSAADQILIVESPDMMGSRGADRMKSLLMETLYDKKIRILLNRYCPGAVNEGWQVTPAEITDLTGLEIIGWLPEEETLKRAVMSADREALKETAALKAAVRIVRRLSGENISMEEPAALTAERAAASPGFFTRLFGGRR